MAKLTFNGRTYTVDHAAKGTDYVHGYDADGNIIVSFDGIKDFSVVTYDGIYMDPADCLTEACNDIKYCEGALKTRDGRAVPASAVGARHDTWMPTAEEVGALGFVGNIIDYGSDFNNCLEEGYYQINNNSSANAPASGFGMLLVMHNDYITQMAFLRNGAVWSRCETTVERLIAIPWTRVDAGASAPAGYGLGTYSAERWISNISEIDNIKTNGVYAVRQQIGSPLVLEGIAFNMLNLEVYMVNALWGTQLVRFLEGYVMRRRYRNGSWEPWEWEDPPMQEGVEYRMTGRFRNYPVYAKLLNVGGINKGNNAIEHRTAVYHPLSVDITNNDQEHLNGSSLFTDISFNRTYLYLYCSSNFGYIRAILKYTKE